MNSRVLMSAQRISTNASERLPAAVTRSRGPILAKTLDRPQGRVQDIHHSLGHHGPSQRMRTVCPVARVRPVGKRGELIGPRAKNQSFQMANIPAAPDEIPSECIQKP